MVITRYPQKIISRKLAFAVLFWTKQSSYGTSIVLSLKSVQLTFRLEDCRYLNVIWLGAEFEAQLIVDKPVQIVLQLDGGKL